MFTNQKINIIINVFCPGLSLLLFQYRGAKAERNLFTFYFLHLHKNVKLLRLPKALNIYSIVHVPKKTLGTMIFQSNLSLRTPLYYGQLI